MHLSRLSVLRQDCRDAAPVHTDLNRPAVRVKGNPFLPVYERLLLPVLVVLGRLGVPFLRVAELPENPPETFIWPDFRIAAQVDSDF